MLPFVSFSISSMYVVFVACSDGSIKLKILASGTPNFKRHSRIWEVSQLAELLFGNAGYTGFPIWSACQTESVCEIPTRIAM